MSTGGQKHIGTNRPPRIHIEYLVEDKGALKSVALPMVIGVMSDLLGTPEDAPEPIENRAFLEIDHDNFESRLRAMKPRIATRVPNRITGEGTLPVELTFKSMEDFTPGAIAKNFEPLKALLHAREDLAALITFMDGKSAAEALLTSALKDPARLLQLSDPTHERSKSLENDGASEPRSTTQVADAADHGSQSSTAEGEEP